jgi:hypothetical protein
MLNITSLGHYAERHIMLSVMFDYYAECHYTECFCADYHYTESRVTVKTPEISFDLRKVFSSTLITPFPSLMMQETKLIRGRHDTKHNDTQHP